MKKVNIKFDDLFQSVTEVLVQRRDELNRADTINHNHGDHMVEIFQVATQAAREEPDPSLVEAVEHASQMLGKRSHNGSAQVYGRGLAQLAKQFRQRQIGLDDLMPYAQEYMGERMESGEKNEGRSAEILKALLAALADWEQEEAKIAAVERGESRQGLELGYLFGVGMAYLQAKQQGGDKLEILAETVVSASPLSKIPYRHTSGKMVVRTLLEFMGESASKGR